MRGIALPTLTLVLPFGNLVSAALRFGFFIPNILCYLDFYGTVFCHSVNYSYPLYALTAFIRVAYSMHASPDVTRWTKLVMHHMFHQHMLHFNGLVLMFWFAVWGVDSNVHSRL
jgi:hypothetical protein